MFRWTNFLFIAVLFCIFFLSPLPLKAQKTSIALFSFRPVNIEAMESSTDILYALTNALEKNASLNVMSRRTMEDILFKAGLPQTDNQQFAIQAGKALGVNFILCGQVEKKGSVSRLTVKLLDILNRKMVQTWTKSFSGRADMSEHIPALSDEIATAISNRSKTPSTSMEGKTSADININGLKAVSQGKQVTITWDFDASLPIASFNIYRSETEQGPYQLIGSSRKNRYEDKIIKSGRTYYYRVGIVMSSGKENKSPHLAMIENAGEKSPYPPLIMSHRGYIRRTVIKFVPSLQNEQENFKIVRYKVLRKNMSDTTWEDLMTIDALNKSQSDLAFTVEDTKGLEDGVDYSYAIISIDKKGRKSPHSDTVSIHLTDRPKLVLKKDNMLRAVSISWQPIKNIDGYFVYRREKEGAWQKVHKIRGADQTGITDKNGLTDEKVYQYYLTAYDDKAETGPSETIEAKTKDLPPPPEKITAESGLVKSVRLKWQPIQDPDIGGYAVFRGTQKQQVEQITKVKGYQSDGYLDKGSGFSPLDDGTTYYYVVVSYNLYGQQGKTHPVVQAVTKPRPMAVKGFKAVGGKQYIQIEWQSNPEPDIRRYILYRNKNDGFWLKLQETSPDNNVYKDMDIKPDAEYRYRIIAEDKDGLESDPVDSHPVLSPVLKKP